VSGRPRDEYSTCLPQDHRVFPANIRKLLYAKLTAFNSAFPIACLALQSGDGLSVLFVVIWQVQSSLAGLQLTGNRLLGDLSNLVGPLSALYPDLGPAWKLAYGPALLPRLETSWLGLGPLLALG
jgi:hypothetical protein